MKKVIKEILKLIDSNEEFANLMIIGICLLLGILITIICVVFGV